MAQQTVTFSELTHALQLDPWWGFCGPESRATNAERVVAELEKTESPRVQGFLNHWAVQPSKGKDFLHAKLIRLLCVAAHLPAYCDTEEALKPEPQPLDWRPHDYAKRWCEEGTAIRLDELQATLEAAHLPLPVRFFDQSGFTSLAKALHTWFERPLSELPLGLRLRVETDFAPLLWDEMNAKQRRKRAQDYDASHAHLRRHVRVGIGGLQQDDDPNDSNPIEKSNAPGEELSVFRAMEWLAFKDITLKVDPDILMIRVEARGKRANVPFHALGLTAKNGVRLGAQGKVFLAMARGDYDPTAAGAKPSLRRLATCLKKAFGINGPPFIKDSPQFSISMPKDRRARKEGERRTIPYDDNRTPGGMDDAAKWLEENYPEFDPTNPTYTHEGG